MTYEIKDEGYAVAWYSGCETAVIYGPIPADEIQDWIDNWPDIDDSDFDDCVGYSLSDLAMNLGEFFNRIQAPADKDGNYFFPINDPTLVGKEDQSTRTFVLTAVPADVPPLHVQLAKELQEMHESTAIDLDLWPTAKAFVKAAKEES